MVCTILFGVTFLKFWCSSKNRLSEKNRGWVCFSFMFTVQERWLSSSATLQVCEDKRTAYRTQQASSICFKVEVSYCLSIFSGLHIVLEWLHLLRIAWLHANRIGIARASSARGLWNETQKSIDQKGKWSCLLLCCVPDNA